MEGCCTSKMVSLGENKNGKNGAGGAGYFFRDSEDLIPPNQAYDIPTNNRQAVPQPRRPAIRQTLNPNRHPTRNSLESTTHSLQPNPFKFKHIYTCYFTIVEIFIITVYVVACFVDILMFDNADNEDGGGDDQSIVNIDKFSIYAIVHIILWCLVGVFDRLIQWQHQIIRRRGYLMFYVRLRNVRRIPYGVFSTGNATLVLFFATRQQLETAIAYTIFQFNYCILILVGIELIITMPILVYYVIITMRSNCKKPSPDAAVSSSTQSALPFSSPPPDLGFNPDAETQNVEELLDKQADMIRYLQFHNANLGRKIMELQNQNRH